MRSSIVAAMVVALCGAGAESARADAGADVTKAFTAFVDGVAAGKPEPAGLEYFLYPSEEEGTKDATALKAMLSAPKVKVLQVMVSPGGKSAWVAAEIPAKVALGGGKPKADTLRATAFLVHDGVGWQIRATHWSLPVKNAKPEACGALTREWQAEADVPATLMPAVRKLLETLDENTPASFGALLSDDKRSLVFGSAPKETFVGAAKIKGVFKKWSVGLTYWDKDDPALPATAGVGPDGELSWVVVGVAYFKLCTSYRTMFVMAQEKGAWKIVHQHYSEPVELD